MPSSNTTKLIIIAGATVFVIGAGIFSFRLLKNVQNSSGVSTKMQELDQLPVEPGVFSAEYSEKYDLNEDGLVDIMDVLTIIEYLFK